MKQYGGAWMFKGLGHNDLAQVWPLTERSSAQIWQRFVSRKNRHPMLLAADEWPSLSATWLQSWRWEGAGGALPAVLLQLPWADDARVYFAVMKERIIETSWAVFKKYWEDFVLIENEGPFLMHPERLEVAYFGPNGAVGVGLRPAEF